jgi:Signal peptidase (SPase) II
MTSPVQAINNNQCKYNLAQLGFFGFLLSINIFLIIIIRHSNIYFVSNTTPFGIYLSGLGLSIIVGFVSWGMFKFKLIQKYPIYSILILSGIWSNVAERVLNGYVTDYINLGFGYANLADLQIWVGVIVLNYFVWRPEAKKPVHHINMGL